MLSKIMRTTTAVLLLFALFLQIAPLEAIALSLEDPLTNDSFTEDSLIEESLIQSELQSFGDSENEYSYDPDAINVFGSSEYPRSSSEITDDDIVCEITEKRDEVTKHFMLRDGSIVASIYNVPVHEINSSGKWVEIDNTLALTNNASNDNTFNTLTLSDSDVTTLSSSDITTLSSSDLTTLNSSDLSALSNSDLITFSDSDLASAYSTVSPSDCSSVHLSAVTAGNNTLTIQEDGHTITWGLNVKSRMLTQASYEAPLCEPSATKMRAKSVSGVVTYANILPDTDLTYQLIGNDIKENIILGNVNAAQPFEFVLTCSDLTAQVVDNYVVLYDYSDNIVKVIEAPYMVDANDAMSANITVTLSETATGYIVTITPDMNWLLDPNRAYPVIIDPTITDNLDSSKIDNTSVNSNNPSSNEMYQYGCVYVGRESAEYGNLRGVFKFTLPSTITESDMVVDANIRLAQRNYNGSGSVTVNVHQITSDLSLSSMTWNALNGKYNSTVLDTQIVSSSTNSTQMVWDITAAVRSWYLNGNNYGLALVSENEGGTYKYATFYTARYPGVTTAALPAAIITYINHDGLEDYLTYHYAGSDTMGTIAVGDFNGNLIYTYTDCVVDSSYMPMSIQHVYNHSKRTKSAVVHSGSLFGNGMRLNISQRIESSSVSGYPYKHTDADGTVHYFKLKTGTSGAANSTYEKEFDSTTILTKGSDGTFTLSNSGNLTYHFTSSGFLWHINDTQNNKTIEISYNSSRPIRIKDSIGQYTTLAYNSSNYLTSITDPSQRVTSFTYDSNNNLTQITKPDGTKVKLAYNSSKRLTSITDIDNSKISISYISKSPYRVSKLTEYGTSGSTEGEKLTWSYGAGETTITDRSGNSETMMFDYSGHTVCIRDGEGHAVFGGYGNTENSNKNSLVYQSDMQGTVTNYLKNSDFEDSTSSPWINYLTGTGSLTLDTTTKYGGNKSAKIFSETQAGNMGYYQNTDIPGCIGKPVTLSAQVKINSISPTTASTSGFTVSIIYKNAAGSWTMNSSPAYKTTTDWQKMSHTFIIPSDASSSTVRACLRFYCASGVAYIDNVQIELGSVSNRYNLLENSHFREAVGATSAASWSAGSLNSSVDKVVAGRTGSGFQITGDPSTTKTLYQNVSVNGSTGDTYVFGGWAKASAIPKTDKTTGAARAFSIQIRFIKADGTYKSTMIDFEAKSPNWQYVTGSYTAPFNYTSVQIRLVYQKQQNAAVFDDIQLYFEPFGSRMTYDTYGRLSTATDSSGRKTTYTYKTAARPEISKITYSDGTTTVYQYDDNYKLLSVTDPNGKKTTYSYDNDGNLTNSSMTADNLTLSSGTNTYTNGHLTLSEDTFGNETSYTYNNKNGLMTSVTDPKGTVTNYTYNANNDYLTGVSSAGHTVSYTYTNGNLSKITHNNDSSNNVNYNFTYDQFGNTASVAVGTQNLITHTYAANNGNLVQSVYGNGHSYEPEYDSLDRIISASYNGVEKYNISYGADGRIGLYNDLASGVTWRYEYAKDGNVTSAICSNGTRLNYSYDTATGKLLSYTVYDGATSKTTSYTYHEATDSNGKKNLINYITLPNAATVDYDYDGFYRASYDIKVSNSTKLSTDYTFRPGSDSGTTSMMVAGLTNSGNGWSKTLNYTYDANGNIATISEGSTLKATYHYDELNQLVREDNKWLNKTIAYTYDKGGNIKSVKEYAYTTASKISSTATNEIEYVYGDSNWKDKLTKYNGKAISYDAIGNRTSYDGYTYTWENGRQLKKITGNNNEITYYYNSDGIRTKKVANGVTTTYTLEGSNVVKETNGTDTLWFYYDATGSVISFQLDDATYFYVKNLQGDIIAITNSSGTKVVEYVYDSWGKLISTTGSKASTVGVKNPYRYRGYRYDTETGFYYLNSRYYDPEMKRFINADSYIQTPNGYLTSTNMFAYCGNNPIHCYDPIGEFFLAATIGGIAVWEFGLLIMGAVAIYLAADTLVKNPPVLPQISLPKIDVKPKAEANTKPKDIAPTTKKRPAKDPVHHIVAKADPRAAESRRILEDVGIKPLTDQRNLVVLPQSYHSKLHTSAYHKYVTEKLRPVAGNKLGVEMTLTMLKAELIVRSSLGIRWD